MIFHHITRIEKSGPNSVMISLILSQLEAGLDVTVLSHQPDADDQAILASLQNAGVVYRPLRSKKVYENVRELKKLHLEHPKKIWHTHCLRSLFCVYMSGHKHIVNTSHNVPHEDWPLEKGHIKGRLIAEVNLMLMRFISKNKNSRVVSISPYMQEQLRQKSIESTYIPNPIDFSDYSLSSLKKIREKSEKIRVVSVGRLIPRKNQKLVIEALIKMGQEAQKIRYTIVGSGEDEAELNSLAKQAKSEIVFTGFQNDPSVHVKEAHYLINPSLSEGMPIAVLEALSYRCSVLLSDIGPHHAFSDAPVGIHFFELSPDSLSNLFFEIASTQPDSENTELYNWAKTRFSSKSVSAKYQDLYKAVIGSKIDLH